MIRIIRENDPNNKKASKDNKAAKPLYDTYVTLSILSRSCFWDSTVLGRESKEKALFSAMLTTISVQCALQSLKTGITTRVSSAHELIV